MFQNMAVREEQPRVSFKAHQHLNPLTCHGRDLVFLALIYLTSMDGIPARLITTRHLALDYPKPKTVNMHGMGMSTPTAETSLTNSKTLIVPSCTRSSSATSSNSEVRPLIVQPVGIGPVETRVDFRT